MFDNQYPSVKINLRLKYLPQDASVLDLYCGSRGVIYHNVYKNRVKQYLGIDKKQPFDSTLCIQQDNLSFIKKNNLENYNVFDLDAYGSPWVLFEEIIKKIDRCDAHFFITDGLVTHFSVCCGVKIIKHICKSEGIPRSMSIPLILRYYRDIIKTLLVQLQEKYGFSVNKANAIIIISTGRIAYWHLHVCK